MKAGCAASGNRAYGAQKHLLEGVVGAWGRIFFFALLFVAATIVAAAWLSGPVAAASPTLTTVVLATLGTAFVALIGVGLWSLHSEDAALDEALAEREADRRMTVALRAEIDLAIREFGAEFDPQVADERRRRAHAAIERSDGAQRLLPSAYAPPSFVVFDRSEDPLTALPDYAIRRVVHFHQTTASLRSFVEALGADRSDDLARADRVAAVDRYFDLGLAALFRALKAKAALSAALRDVDKFPEERWRAQLLAPEEAALAERILGRASVDPLLDAQPIGGLIEQSEPS